MVLDLEHSFEITNIVPNPFPIPKREVTGLGPSPKGIS